MPRIYSIFDKKCEVFGAPSMAQYPGEAERMFDSLVNYGESMVSQYPGDFDLYYLGDYDQRTGKVECRSEPVFVVNGAECVRRDLEDA